MNRLIFDTDALRHGIDRSMNAVAASTRSLNLNRLFRRPMRGVVRFSAEMRAAARQNRRPAVLLLVGTSMMVPMGVSILAPGRSAGEVPVAAPLREPSAEPADLRAMTWAEDTREQQEADTVRRFAREFSISPTLAEQIQSAASRYEIEPEVAFGLVRAESSFRRSVVSHAGAVGYTQLLPSTARWIAPNTTRSALFDPETNLDVGFRYLRYLIDKYDGSTDLALTAYNRGPGNVDRLLRRGRNPDNGYARMIYTGKASQTLIRQNSPRSG